jgi:hypothetical protein
MTARNSDFHRRAGEAGGGCLAHDMPPGREICSGAVGLGIRPRATRAGEKTGRDVKMSGGGWLGDQLIVQDGSATAVGERDVHRRPQADSAAEHLCAFAGCGFGQAVALQDIGGRVPGAQQRLT